MTEIDVEDIVSECDDLDMLADIIYLISRVDMKNKRLSVLTTLDAPEIIIRSEKRILQKRAEQLASTAPVMNRLHGGWMTAK